MGPVSLTLLRILRSLLRALRDMAAGVDAAAMVWHGIPVPDDHPARRQRDAAPTRVTVAGQQADPGRDLDTLCRERERVVA